MDHITEETKASAIPAEFANDVPEGVALVYVNEETLNNFIQDTRAEVQYCIQYSGHLSKIILDEEHQTVDGVSMSGVIALLDEIEADLRKQTEDPQAMLRLRRSITAMAASLNCPIPPRFMVMDHISQTAISMLANIANKMKAEELREKIRVAQAENADVPEAQGIPTETPTEAKGDLEKDLLLGMAAVAENLIN